VSINIKALLTRVKQEMEIVYHSSIWLTSVNDSSNLTILEFIETNRHIESMQQRIKNMIQVEKDQKADILFKVSAMAHDLKTPLTVIKGNSELLQLAPLSGIDVQCLKDIERASNQLNSYFNQLINYSKTFYSDQISFHQYRISNLSKILEQECTYLIGDSIDYKYSTKIDRDCNIELDLDLIIRSVANIVNNAIAYADDAKKKIRVTFELADSNITLSIWNNGSKFSDDVLENFGKLFYREDTSRNSQFEHFGIGLAFVKQVMSIHSGDIQLQNKENGAMVKLIIPMKSSDYV
ncbi:TPA: sensor histidine kinase, partial [Streptococcus pneumoniae]